MRPDLLTPTQASEYLGAVPPATLSWWRSVGRGPPFLKVGRRILYRRRDLDSFLESCERG